MKNLIIRKSSSPPKVGGARGGIIKRIRLRTWISLGLIIVLTPLIFAMVYGVLGALGGSNATPVAHWSFDEGVDNTCSGGTNDACDGSGNSLDGARTNAVWQIEDKCVSGKCMFFDGTGDYVDMGDPAGGELDFGTGDFTIMAWVRYGTTNDMGIITKLNGSNVGYSLGEDTGKARLFIDQDHYIDSSTNINDNKWHHLVAQRSGTTLNIFVDGQEDESNCNSCTTASGDTSNSNNFEVSGNRHLFGNRFNGFIDEAKVFDTALSAAQIKAEYAGGAAVLGTQDTDFLNEGLVGYWNMDDNDIDSHSCPTGSTGDLCDRSGNNLHGLDAGSMTDGDYVGGKFGSSLDFDGGDDVITVADPGTGSALDLSSTLSISAWVYQVNTGTFTDHVIARKINSGDSSFNYQFRIREQGTSFPIFTITDTDTNTYTWTSSSTITESVWEHVAVSYSTAGGIYVAINGVASSGSWDVIPPENITLSTNNDNLRIGASDITFTGRIDELRLYNRAFSPAEIKALYNWAPGPIAYYKTDEGSGTTAFDSSSNALNGTITAATYTQGRYGSALSNDGSSTYVTVSDNNTLDLSYDVTVAAWIKPSSSQPSSFANVLSKGGNTGNSFNYSMNYNTDGTAIRFHIGDNAENLDTASATSPSTDTWHHVVGTADSSNVKIYMDGVLMATTPRTVATLGATDNPLCIGRYSNDTVSSNLCNDSTYSGDIDDVRIYNYARTPQQIVEDMNGGHPTGGSPVGSHVAYWNLDEMSGTTAYDDSINENNLTLSAASWTPSGKYNGAWNGTNAVWLSRADDADFDVSATDDYSASIWFKSDSASNPGATEYLFNKANATTAGYAVYVNTSGQVCFGIDDDTTWGPDVASCSSADVYDTAWHNVIAVRNVVSDQLQLYVDGILVDSDTDSTSATLANSLSLYVGDRDGTNNGDEFSGDTDEIKVYRSALTSDQVKIVYNAGSSTNFGAGTDEKSTDFGGPGGNPPVLYWSFDENADNTCGGGADVCDKSGNGIHLTNTNMESTDWAPGKYGASLDYGATDEYSTYNDTGASVLDIAGSFSLSAWAYFDVLDTDDRTIISKSISGGDEHNYYIITANNDIECGFWNNVQGDLTADVNLVAGQWYHLVCVHDASTDTTTLFVNGAQGGQVTGITNSPPTGDADLYIGEDPNIAWQDPMDGRIDEVKIFDYALSQAQIAYEYNRGGSIGWWKFDECTGTTAYNYVLDGNDQAAGMNGVVTPGSLDNTTAGTCSSGTGTEMWNDGTSGKFNGSLGFDGDDDYVVVASPTLPTGDFTVALWWKGTTVGNETLFHVPNAANGNELQLKSASQVQLFTNGSQTVTGGSTLSTGIWYHLAATRSGSALTVYVNGKSDGTGTDGTAFDFSTCSIYIGTDFGCGATQANPADGQIDDVRVYNYALSPEQIAKIMNGDSGTGSAVRFGPAEGSP